MPILITFNSPHEIYKSRHIDAERQVAQRILSRILRIWNSIGEIEDLVFNNIYVGIKMRILRVNKQR